MPKVKYKKYELEKCECGHTVPLDFTTSDDEGCYICYDCYIKELSARIDMLYDKVRKKEIKIRKLLQKNKKK